MLTTPLFVLALLFSLPLFTKAQTCDPIDRLRLRNILVELGYEVKDIIRDAGKEKFSISLKKAAQLAALKAIGNKYIIDSSLPESTSFYISRHAARNYLVLHSHHY